MVARTPSSRRCAVIAGAFVCLATLGCDRTATPDEVVVPEIGLPAAFARVIAPVDRGPLPEDAPGVLRELSSVPTGAVVIVYDVVGPAGLSGTLEVLAADGGLRRDNWSLSLPLPDGVREIRGSAVVTPDTLWRAEGEDAGVVEPGRLRPVADAIVALDPVTRIAVLTQIRSWRAELEQARAEDPGEVDVIAGVPCVRVRAGGGEVCTWEEAGLPLRYDGSAFSIVATHVEQNAELGAHAFDIPAMAARAPSMTIVRDPGPQLAAIAAGDRAALLRVVVADALLGAPAPEAG